MHYSELTIQKIDKYDRHGCYFTGNLVIVEYIQIALNESSKKSFGGWGSCTTYDYLDKARKLLKEKYPNAKELLSLPDLVARID